MEALGAVLDSDFGGVEFLLCWVHDGLDFALGLLADGFELALEGLVLILSTAPTLFGLLPGLLLAALALDLFLFGTAQFLLHFFPELFLLTPRLDGLLLALLGHGGLCVNKALEGFSLLGSLALLVGQLLFVLFISLLGQPNLLLLPQLCIVLLLSEPFVCGLPVCGLLFLPELLFLLALLLLFGLLLLALLLLLMRLLFLVLELGLQLLDRFVVVFRGFADSTAHHAVCRSW